MHLFRVVRLTGLCLFWLFGWAALVSPDSSGGIQGRVLIEGTPATDAVVWLEETGAGSVLPAPVEQTIRQRHFRFDPSFSVVTVGSTLRFENLDHEIHNVKSDSRQNRFDLGAHFPGTVKTVVLERAGAVVIRCKIHQEMRGLVFVSPTPYVSRTDGQGRYEIAGVPRGEYRVAVWHPRLTVGERQAGSVTVRVDARTVPVDLKLQAAAPAGTDLTDAASERWIAIVQEIRDAMGEAMHRWQGGSPTGATIKVMTTLSKLYGQSGLRVAIQERIGPERAIEHERRFDAIRKKMQRMPAEKASEKVVGQDIDRLLDDLMADALRLETLAGRE